MQKFLSLFCALAIVLSVTAAPVSKKDVLAGKVAKKELHAKKALKDAPKTALVAAPAKKVTALTKANGAKLRKAPQAKKEVIDLVFAENAEYDWTDYVATQGWWQLQVEDENYYLSLTNKETTEVAGTYTTDDMDLEYSALWIAGTGYIYFTACDITLAVDETDGFKLTVTGSFDATDGNTYKLDLVYQKAPILPGDFDFVAVSESHSFYSTDGDVYYTFRDAEDNVMHFDIVLPEGLEDVEIDATYTLENMLANYSNVTFDDEKSAFKEASFKKTIDAEGAEVYTATATDEYDRVFHLTYTFKAPEALFAATITAPVTVTSEVVLFWTEYTFTAQDEENAISFTIVPDDTYFGTWEAGKDATGSVFNIETETPSDIYSGEITITETAEGFKVSGKVLCFNNTEYTLDLTYVIPDKTRDAELTISGLTLGLFDGAWQLRGFNEDTTQFVSIAAYTDEISGTYAKGDLAADYCYIYTDLEWDEEGNMKAGNLFELLKANLTVVYNETDSTIVITGSYLGQNGDDVPEFTLNLSGKASASSAGGDCTDDYDATEDFIVDFAEFETDDSGLLEYGVWVISAQNAQGQYISLQIAVDELVAGEYPVLEDSEAPFTVAGALDLNEGAIYGSCAGNLTADGLISLPLWALIDGKVVINEDGSVNVDATNCQGAAVKCTLGGAQAVDNVNAAVKATKRVVNGALIIEKNGIRYNAQGAVVK